MRRLLLFGWMAAACREEPTDPSGGLPRGSEPAAAPAPATLRKLTATEYLNTLVDLFGEDLVLPTAIEPDLVVDGLLSVGAGQAAISPLGVEQYEEAAYLVAGQVTSDPALRGVVPCSPSDTVDPSCSAAFAREFGRLAWRRALTADEVATVADLADGAAAELGDFWDGLAYGLAYLLQSPSFVYRIEVGEGGAFSSVELASRMSYLLWSGPPDTELLDLGEDGSLLDPEVRRAEVERMLLDPRARRGVRVFFAEMLGLAALDSVVKDPELFVHWSEGIAPAAREQTLATVEHLVFEEDADFRDLLVSRTTFLDRGLAALYGVPAPAREGFGPTELPEDGERLGLLGQVSFLALQAHSVSTSVTRRGKFVQTVLLCREIPPPPANVDTSIPEPSADAPTMRDRVASHLEVEYCASCHRVTDPIGLAFEHFDGIGRYRETDDGHALDTTGDLDGLPFDGAIGVAWAVHDHPELPSCLSETLLRYAQGHVLSAPEEDLASWHAQGFTEVGHRWQALLTDLVTAESFGTAGTAP